ncbi:SDR family oxidoreductase (plasmid) [Burkholderia humptydooensis]|uniref:SDR family oxidoreductase n=2 Tax=Burkholderia humptydooensis TaxID=430531 RepID=A0A7U4P847_9BURK|nr:polyketide synthase [Burkholderia humptydooensis]EIP84603.1 polyketide synthase [Burkholderia humptydooensis MSMB43]QPS42103.1 SDR family oxidoreductase [Burkholderia humptydooensis]
MAIIGASCRLPGAATLEQFWSMIAEGRVAIERFGADAARREGVPETVLAQPGFVGAGGPLDGVDQFDAAYFGIQPAQAAAMDPQQRIFLECVHEALERAGHGAVCDARVGIWAGSATVDYLVDHVHDRLDRASPNRYLQQWVGVDKDYLATQVAYRLDFGGPAITLQTACSTSLVAVVQALQGLLSFQCDFAVAGGVSVALPQRQGHVYEEGSILSADGACRPFTTDSSGTVFGNGAGVVVLRRLEDALADGDPIMAVIRGGAINNDGAAKVGFTAPGGRGQNDVIRQALALSEVDGTSIGYVETHGTGTAIGDEVELAALRAALGERAEADARCALGTLKANVGHLNAAAGACGLIKAALAVEHGQIPAAVGAAHAIDALRGDSVFYLPAATSSWDAPVRRAGVSSFGIGGTNAHVIVEAAPPRAPRASHTAPLLLLSARGAALPALCADYAAFLDSHPELRIEDVCLTAALGRRHWEQRAAFRAASRAELIDALRAFAAGEPAAGVIAAEVPARVPEVSFAFGGAHDLDGVLARVQVWQASGVSPASVCATGDGVFAAAFAAGALSVDDARQRRADRAVAPSLLWIGAASGLPLNSAEAVRAELANAAAASAADATAALEAAGAEYVLDFGDTALGAQAGGMVSLDPASPDALARLWTAGMTLDLAQHYRGGNRVLLPTYPFQRQRHWIDRAPRFATGGATPFLGRRTDAPALNATFFDAEWSVATLPFLQDHVIYDKVVVSGAALAVMIADGARALTGSDACVLSDLRFPAALVIPPGAARLVQLQLVRDGDGFEATVLTPETVDIHATARVDAGEAPGVAPSEAVQGEAISADLLDMWLRARSVVMGPTFRRLSEMVVGNGEASCAMRADAEDEGWHVHPGILDSVLQLVAAAARPEGSKAFVPTRIARLTLHGRTGARMRCHASAGRGQASVFDGSRMLIELIGLESREVTRNELLRIEPLRDGYAVEWRDVADGARAALPEPIVIVRDAGQVAAGLASLLRDERKDAQVVTRVDEIPFDRAGLIVDCRGVDARADAPDAARYEGALALFAAAARRDQPCRIAVVLAPDAPASAPLQALSRAVAMETPHLQTLALHAGDAHAIRRGLDYIDRETEVAVRGDAVSAPRFEERALPRRADLALAGDATWLITGGLGELGLRVAGWLVALGARTLVLTGRRPADAAAEAVLVALRRDGVDVRVRQADVAVETDVDALLAEIDATLPPLRGICHLAGVVEDRLVVDVTPESLAATLAGKAHGAWLLHERTRRHPLEHFVLFSSAAAAFGAPGQSTYAMANAYLDALAAHRRAQGLPALSIAWGPWQDVGMLARTSATAKRRLAQLGIGQIETECGCATFEIALATALPPHIVLLPVDWPKLIEQWPPHVPASRFAEIAAAQAGAAITSSVAELLALPADERRARLFQLLAEDAAAVTGTPLASLDPERSLFDYDLDSLLITDLRVRLEKRFGRTISTTVIFSNPTIAALADHLARTIFGAADSAPATPAVPLAAARADAANVDMSTDTAQLSQEEIVEMLSAKLDELRGAGAQ